MGWDLSHCMPKRLASEQLQESLACGNYHILLRPYNVSSFDTGELTQYAWYHLEVQARVQDSSVQRVQALGAQAQGVFQSCLQDINNNFPFERLAI